MKEKKYKINGKTWHQRKLVPGQVQQLCGELSGIEGFRFMNITDAEALVIAIGSRLLPLLAIVLIPEGVEVKKKNLKEIADDLFDADIDAMEIISDFFVLNPTDSLFNKLSGFIGKITTSIVKKTMTAMKGEIEKATSKTSSSSSPEETSPSATT